MEERHGEQCCCPNNRRPENGILYGLLASPSSPVTMETCSVIQAADNGSGSQGSISCYLHHQTCPCHHHNHHHHHHHYHHNHHHHHHHHNNFQQSTVKVSLKNPGVIQQEAAELLLKSMVFVKNLPTFWELRREDRLQLFLNGWSDLFILKMAQNNFQFEVQEHTTEQSQEQTNLKLCPPQLPIPVSADVKKIKNFIQRCQSLRLDDKEYAYMKSVIYFNPEVPLLLNTATVEEFQSNAQLCLSEYLAAMHPNDPLRFARVLLGLPTLRDIKPQVLIELFFRPLIGDVCMEEVLAAMLEQESPN
ncbi:nuclear receptor subfamily 0 group B member 2-like [Glandiceps talaboti]